MLGRANLFRRSALPYFSFQTVLRSYKQSASYTTGVASNVYSVLGIFDLSHPTETEDPREVTTRGWIQTVRSSKHCSFVEVNDGSTHSNLQIVIDKGVLSDEDSSKLQTGASIDVHGDLVYHFNRKLKAKLPEIQCKRISITGDSPVSFPLQKKYHSREFLRENLHLRPRTRRFGATMRLRSQVSWELQNYLNEQGVVQIHTPIITSSDCEGSGELFEVTESRSKEKKDFFFNKPAFLGVSGQLHLEAFACSMSKVYTFGPTFRAEMSHTQQHLSEFWMLEPELVHADLNDCVDLTRNLIVNTVDRLLVKPNIASDLEFLFQSSQETNVDSAPATSFQDTLKFSPDTLVKMKDESMYQVITYNEAINLLSKHSAQLSSPVDWNEGLSREHELYLVHKLFDGKPVFVLNYPRQQKAFYMKQTSDSNDTVACMDLLLPIVGEVAGGSEREDCYGTLVSTMAQRNIGNNGEYDWYLDLRKYGSVPHAGFGIGFERLIQVLTCTRNIRDVIPMPRSYHNCFL